MKKEKNFTLRFTYDQMEYIKARAEKADVTPSMYIRTMALKGKIVQFEGNEYMNMMTEMSRIGSNINQITRRLNEQGSFYYDELVEIREEHEKLCRILSQYLSTLHRTEQ